MAVIRRNWSIPNNIVRLPVRESRRIRAHFERGDLVILSDVRVHADFECIATAEPAAGAEVRKQKYIFRKLVDGQAEVRESVWRRFFGSRLKEDPAGCKKVRRTIEDVDRQLDRIVRAIFNQHDFGTQINAWKFLHIDYENLHIDNLPNLNETAQVRLFANVDVRPRAWSVGRHWRHYAKRLFLSEGLHELVDDAVILNGRLNHAAFGPSWTICDEPRHFIEFEPGEIWLLNSPLVAHQVRNGSRLCSAHYEYPYEQCIDIRTSLPHQIAEMARKRRQGQPSLGAVLRPPSWGAA